MNYYVFKAPGRTYHLSPGAMALLAEPAAAIGVSVAFEVGLMSARSAGAGAIADWALGRPDGDVDLERLLAVLDCLGWSVAAALHEWRAA